MQLLFMVRIVQRLFCGKGFLMGSQWNLRKPTSFPTAWSPHVSMGLSFCKAQQYVWMWVSSSSEPREPTYSTITSFLVRESAQGCNVTVDVSSRDSLQTHAPAAGRGSPSRASWFLPALAASYSTAWGFLWLFPSASRRGTDPLFRARIGHLDLNVGGFVGFGIQFWSQLLEINRIDGWHIHARLATTLTWAWGS